MNRFSALGMLVVSVAFGVGCGGGSDSAASQFAGSSDGISCLIPESQLVSGGPGRDGIPSLTNPVVVSAEEGAQIWAPSTLILGVVEGGEARAYPHAIFWWHEIVNDTLGGVSDRGELLPSHRQRHGVRPP